MLRRIPQITMLLLVTLALQPQATPGAERGKADGKVSRREASVQNTNSDGEGSAGTEPMGQIRIDPYCVRSIRGIRELRREVYFGLCDHGMDFDRRCKSNERYELLVKEYGITFGRALGVVNGLDRFYKAIKEDPSHKGFADTFWLKDRLAARLREPSEMLRRDVGGRLHVAAHEQHNVYPEFMGVYQSKANSREKVPCRLPENLDAAAELAAATLRYGYTDFNRPTFFEPINEPHWSYWSDEHLARWHLQTMEAVHRTASGVLVGGPCLPVAYFYKKQYDAFKGLKAFITNTQCKLDFYSFHIYDFLRERGDDFGGRITSGLPLESMLDLVQNHTMNEYGREIGIVVSEHGGYGAEELVERLAKERFPGGGFEWEMRKRSIDDFNMVRSAIANSLVFMDHPQTIKKAVPFILLEAMAWNPKYYAVLYVPRDYRDKNDWVPTQKVLFYRLFRDLKGHRVAASCGDPDIQTRAFVDGKTLLVVLNNLSNVVKTVTLDMPRGPETTIRRFGRNPDYTPYLTEGPEELRSPLVLQARETIVVKVEHPERLAPRRAVDEIPCYGDRIATVVEGRATFMVKVPKADELQYATLRIGISRPRNAGHEVAVSFNGVPVKVPVEQCAERLVEDEYASCKLIQLSPKAVRQVNTVTVSFPDGHKGSVGAVVLRAGVTASKTPGDRSP